jgi:pyruvate dehydrogenase E2 component (dihydrolipoamide acetyltransferase)
MQVVIPEIIQNVQKAEILALLVRVGQHVLAEQPVLELEAGKASFELPCPVTGKIEQILVRIGDDVEVGDVVLTLQTVDETEHSSAASSAPTPSDSDTADTGDDRDRHDPGEVRAPARTPYVRASPAARRRARELNVDLDELDADDRGRVTIEQIEARAVAMTEQSGVFMAGLDDLSAHASPAELGSDWRSVPQVAVHETIDVTCLEAARRRYRDEHEGGPRLTLTTFVVKACAIALREHPRMNSSLIRQGRALAIKRYIHIAVTVDTECGRVAPVVTHADQRPLCELAAELETLTISARRGHALTDQAEPPTFSITNLRSFGGTRCTPVIHPPLVSALGLCRARNQSGRTLLPVSLACDQRVNDEAAARAYVATVAELLRDPMAMLMRT